MNIRCFKRGNLYCIWDDNLLGKDVVVADSLNSLYEKLEMDEIPVYNCDNPQTYVFSGKRIHRGLYVTSGGMMINADVNGSLNILRKSNVVDLAVLYARGGVDTPVRIRVA